MRQTSIAADGIPSSMVTMDAIRVLSTELDGDDGILVTFSDGTTGAYVVEELHELRPVRELTKTGKASGTLYDVHFKGGGVRKRVTGRSLRGLRAPDVDWLWNAEQKRRETPDEIQRLCKGASRTHNRDGASC